MSLKVYQGQGIQSFYWDYSGFVLFGLQLAPLNKLLKIYNAFWPSNDAITSVKAIKINTAKEIIEETELSTNLIAYDDGQYQVVDDILLVENLDECIYYLEFSNGIIFQTEPFLVMEAEIDVNNFVFMSTDNFVLMDGNNFIFQK